MVSNISLFEQTFLSVSVFLLPIKTIVFALTLDFSLKKGRKRRTITLISSLTPVLNNS